MLDLLQFPLAAVSRHARWFRDRARPVRLAAPAHPSPAFGSTASADDIRAAGSRARRAEAPEARRRAVTPPAPAADHAPEWLIDNADAYDRIVRAIVSAQHSVWLTQLAFDADCVSYDMAAPGERPDAAPPSTGTVLADALLAAVARAPIEVRILLNATLLLDTTPALRRFFEARIDGLGVIPGRVSVRGLKCFPQLLHAKMLIVDGREAFFLGSPFANGYWDDPRHLPLDSRRPHRELGGRPLHDLSLRVTGTPVAECERIFTGLWRTAARGSADAEDPNNEPPPHLRAVQSPPTVPWLPPSGGRSNARAQLPPEDGSHERMIRGLSRAAAVRIVCTSPAGVLPGARRGETHILDALLEGIGGARSLIYVEHQYLSARPVVSALVQALSREPVLELILVLNQNPDVTAYPRWQNARLAESGLLSHPRVGVFALWTAACGARGQAPVRVNQVFVHSKAVIVDDRWVTAGSANLDGVSLHSYGDDFTRPVARRVFRGVRNFDINVVVDDGPVTGSAAQRVAGLRARLWSEHLDLPAASVTHRPRDGWLSLWRARAGGNVAALARPGAAEQMRGFVLPYSTARTPARQLIDLGVDVNPARIDLRFNPGWFEVQFSANWLRNKFR